MTVSIDRAWQREHLKESDLVQVRFGRKEDSGQEGSHGKAGP